MRRDRNLSDHWIAHARRIDFGLTSDMPTNSEVHVHPQPTPYDLDYHSAFEFGMVLTGAHERHYEDIVMPVLPGQVWWCTTWEPHGWRVTQPGTKDLVIMFIPELLGDERIGSNSWLDIFALPPEQRPQLRTDAAQQQALAIGDELAREIAAKAPGWVHAIKFNVLRLLLLVWRQWHADETSASSPRIGTTALSRIIPALELLHDRPAFRVSVAEAAEACGLSRSHFNLLFRQAMGLSFGRFNLRARLAAAAYQITTLEYPLETIADQCGFVDASHLHRAFHHHYGCTPAEYRRRFR